jgi:uncharacterized membrane protein HdeD (DUF308 family)
MSTQITEPTAGGGLERELGHLRSSWWCLFLVGLLLMVCGTVALVVPALTVLTSFATVVVLGVALLVAGIVTIITSFWAGKWSATLLHLLVGILYVVAGFVIADTPVTAALMLTAFAAALFILVGVYRTLAAFIIRFPQWGWAVLNGVITFLLGVVIYRHFPQSALWLIGVLVGVELLFHGWSWIMLSLAVRKIPAPTT